MNRWRRKVIAGVVFATILSGVGAYLLLSTGARGFLRRSGAVAIKSFEDVFAPSAADGFVSEIDLAPVGLIATTSDKSNTSSPPVAVTGESPVHLMADQRKIDSDVIPPESGALQSGSPADFPATEGNTTSEAGDVSATTTVPAACSFPGTVPTNVPRRLILNEIAWMGSSIAAGETASQAADREWIELKNISDSEINLDGWRVMDVAENIKITFGSGDKIAPGALYLLSRNGSPVNGLAVDKTYTGVLPNSGDKLVILDASCTVSDVLDASAKWPGGSNATKQTLERTSGLGWQTSMEAGGTPRVENSAGAPLSATASSSVQKYEVSVTIAGDGGGSVKSQPGNAVCASSCTKAYPAGAKITLSASPGKDAGFIGWSGGCSGTSSCSFTVGGPVSVVADFHLNVDETLVISNDSIIETTGDALQNASSSESATETSSSMTVSSRVISENPSSTPSLSTSTPPSTASSSVDHLVIAAVQIAGASSNNDVVKIYNPTAATVDISGWKLRKKSSTGTDSSLREFPEGSTIASGSYFVWANSAGDFAQSIGADISSTATLAANNSVALFDGNGARTDAVAWGTGTDQYVETSPYPQSPPAGQFLGRKFVDGVIVDTDNNNDDFAL